MFEVITAEDGSITYQGNNWIQALTAFFQHITKGVHVVIFEEATPVREWHPTLGHTADNDPIEDQFHRHVS